MKQRKFTNLIKNVAIGENIVEIIDIFHQKQVITMGVEAQSFPKLPRKSLCGNSKTKRLTLLLRSTHSTLIDCHFSHVGLN